MRECFDEDSDDSPSESVTKTVKKLSETNVIVVGSRGSAMTYINGWVPRENASDNMPSEPNVAIQEGFLLCGPDISKVNFHVTANTHCLVTGQPRLLSSGCSQRHCERVRTFHGLRTKFRVA